MQTYGKVHVERVASAESFAALIGALNLQPPVLIKPNWGTVECYSEADILDWTLSAIPGEKIVVESHGWARDEATLQHRPAGGLTKANLRKGDAWFRAYAGIDRVLEKHGVEYLNLTEEIWAGRAADPVLVQQAVEERYTPVQSAEHYARVPARLYALRGGTLLSLAKVKLAFYPLGISMSIKNLFGLIPGPSRGKYHGRDHVFLDQNIVDLNKIYHSLFAVKGVVEAVHSAGYHQVETERTRILPGCGAAFASEDTVSLDAFALAACGRDPDTVGHLRLAAQTFGGWDARVCADAESCGVNPLNL
jgi:uncharacterized protein (DUF362 family)